MSDELYRLKTYTADMDFLFSTYIRAYDISKANINILLYKGMINKEEYQKLYNAPRMYRQKSIGYLLKDKQYQKALDQGLIEIKKQFFESNQLEASDILSIKNDAIFIISKIPSITKFQNVEFIHKNTYSSYVRLMKGLELYYYQDRINDDQLISVKGINDEKLVHYHLDYMLNFISYIICDIELGELNNTIGVLRQFYQDYVSLRLEKEYYRTFNSESKYVIRAGGYTYLVDEIKEEELQYVDISYNANIIRYLYRTASEMYFKNNR